MITALIIENKNQNLESLLSRVNTLLPEIVVKASTSCPQEYRTLVHQHRPELVFINPSLIDSKESRQEIFKDRDRTFICMADNFDFAQQPCYWKAVGYLHRPLKDRDLVLAVEKAREAIGLRKAMIPENLEMPKSQSIRNKRLIGIPTMEGFEIILVDDIIRCEGLQKCTRIITRQKSDLVSSYNIGEFKKMLQPFGIFFCPHRSHLVNMLCVQKFKRAGAIALKNGTEVPMAKNRKEEFLQRITHL